MSTLFPAPIAVIRASQGAFSSTGVFVPGPPIDLTYMGTCQPDTGKDFVPTEPGRANIGRIKIYVSAPMQVSTEGQPASGDQVIYDGKLWEVVKEMPCQNSLIPHYKYIAEYRGEAS